MSNPHGCLYVVATPIGNLGDISERARNTLAEVDCIAAEDTRHTQKLLAHLDVRTPLISLHEHNEAARVQPLLARLAAGEQIALVSDAGTPLISDPGYRLVREARLAGVSVITVPGPSSVTAALSVAGLPSDRFFFEGFLPARTNARRERLSTLGGLSHSIVIFEAGRRLLATLEDMITVYGASREIAVCRELTKRFESVLTGSLETVKAAVAADANAVRGEFVLVLAPGEDDGVPDAAIIGMPTEALLSLLRAEGLGAKAAARVAAAVTGEPINRLYPLATKVRPD